ncbi:nucleotidyltransferase substrate binding protein [Endozoicomonas sp. 8E]|uniref:nucleotidyltransferase substrate binding protein n=1 Tax=Endozoicomonas sp. 8E TaxID=3035692 RepID=UPI0029391158|nr:nucleotidyltransferase substrate binding protein [Endozoicomonas sp. 8E]WOG27205.1 nucleotidyltransferase substrate binding protein [Endozoicomonas sp. 8E]
MVDFGKFKQSLVLLESQFGNWQTLDTSLPTWIQEAVSESVIRRFVICYDSLWKALKRYLKEGLGLPDVPNSPKPLFRIANENRLLTSDVAQWLIYADTRIGTSHDYDGEKAKAALNIMDAFIKDSVKFYVTMSGETWS